MTIWKKRRRKLIAADKIHVHFVFDHVFFFVIFAQLISAALATRLCLAEKHRVHTLNAHRSREQNRLHQGHPAQPGTTPKRDGHVAAIRQIVVKNHWNDIFEPRIRCRRHTAFDSFGKKSRIRINWKTRHHVVGIFYGVAPYHVH